jgi:hypothetical protein
MVKESTEEDSLVQKLKEVFEKVQPLPPEDSYPEQALALGTYVRPQRINKLGVVIDAFYGDVDEDNQKIIIYTILLFPQTDPLTRMPKKNDQYYLTNEYEYEITAYLMIRPAKVSDLMSELGGGVF